MEILDIFDGAYNLNPCFSPDNRSIYFLSDADGFRNLYRYDHDSQMLFRLTDLMTGISGITAYSPAISVAGSTDLVAYTYYLKGKYQIYAASGTEFDPVITNKNQIDYEPGILHPSNMLHITW